jgi:2-hydroxy-3-keto-5-methylthiopentenyl-1-phosphate phosphatase
MPQVRTVLVDFDGTACLHDVAEHLLTQFGDPAWPSYDDAVDRGEIGLRRALTAQDGMLDADRSTLLAYALEHCPLDPTFAGFVAWLADAGVRITLVSDGFGFYIRPILERGGLPDLPVITNEQIFDERQRPAGLRFVSGHPICVGCGTCKMQAAIDAQDRGPVAFVGEGQSDRWGALYSDLVFAKDALVGFCRSDGIPFVPWTDFDDVRRVLEEEAPLPGAVAPARCPGWRDP